MSKQADIQPVIEAIVTRLVAEYSPQKVILFGSYADGHPDEDSDIDLLIIKSTSEQFLRRLDHVRRVVTGTHPRIPFDPIVLTPEELEQRLQVGDQFIAGILERGKVLYAA